MSEVDDADTNSNTGADFNAGSNTVVSKTKK
jgi:hypothetical protein